MHLKKTLQCITTTRSLIIVMRDYKYIYIYEFLWLQNDINRLSEFMKQITDIESVTKTTMKNYLKWRAEADFESLTYKPSNIEDTGGTKRTDNQMTCRQTGGVCLLGEEEGLYLEGLRALVLGRRCDLLDMLQIKRHSEDSTAWGHFGSLWSDWGWCFCSSGYPLTTSWVAH